MCAVSCPLTQVHIRLSRAYPLYALSHKETMDIGGEEREREREVKRKRRAKGRENDNESRMTTVSNAHMRWTSLS